MIIDLRNVRFGYKGTTDALAISITRWSIMKGERVLVHGPSGGGKSTLLNLISGMLTPHSGEITVAGSRLDRMSGQKRDRFRAAQIGYVFQQFNLIPHLNAVDNISLANYFARPNKPLATRAHIESLLDDLNISSSIRRLRSDVLSSGERQRVAIARALVNQPQLLIADEPTSALDMENRDNFMERITSLAASNNTTLLFVSHDPTLGCYFDRVAQLSDFCETGDSQRCS